MLFVARSILPSLKIPTNFDLKPLITFIEDHSGQKCFLIVYKPFFYQIYFNNFKNIISFIHSLLLSFFICNRSIIFLEMFVLKFLSFYLDPNVRISFYFFNVYLCNVENFLPLVISLTVLYVTVRGIRICPTRTQRATTKISHHHSNDVIVPF